MPTDLMTISAFPFRQMAKDLLLADRMKSSFETRRTCERRQVRFRYNRVTSIAYRIRRMVDGLLPQPITFICGIAIAARKSPFFRVTTDVSVTLHFLVMDGIWLVRQRTAQCRFGTH
jgi:hypothetical protein